jgi:hypothetical protein
LPWSTCAMIATLRMELLEIIRETPWSHATI